ncbi:MULTISPECIES: hypothetical protein [unclassified Mycobacterium]|nr:MULTISPECIES: hypothetical protein [unclassified Mycobacterium]
MTRPPEEEPTGIADRGEGEDGQLSLFDVQPHEKRYVDAPNWPPEPTP